MQERLAELDERTREAELAGGHKAIERQHERGKLTARERIGKLLDPGSFNETDQLVRHRSHGFGIENRRPPGDAVVTGWG
ncbi:MAG TPA: carboxyl transferase domain-containing protein, partial [Actinomycetota bacterium]|nr:carboxyl transferase domain-containing protein [Actinomycetota bacterium]